jgi:hypothetical protein
MIEEQEKSSAKGKKTLSRSAFRKGQVLNIRIELSATSRDITENLSYLVSNCKIYMKMRRFCVACHIGKDNRPALAVGTCLAVTSADKFDRQGCI